MRPFLLVLTLVSGAAFLSAGSGSALEMDTISARTAKPGDVIDIVGVGLDTRNVDELYLTDHKFDMRVKVLEQKDTLIKFRVPPFARPGRMQILVLTKGDAPKLLEQPLYLVIEEPSTEVTQVKPPADSKPAEGQSKEPAKQDK